MHETIDLEADATVDLVCSADGCPGWRVGQLLPRSLTSLSGAIYRFHGYAFISRLERRGDGKVSVTVSHRSGLPSRREEPGTASFGKPTFTRTDRPAASASAPPPLGRGSRGVHGPGG